MPLPYEIRVLLKDHDARVRRGDPTIPTSVILPASSSGGSSSRRPDAVREALRNNGLSMIEDCVNKAPPFEVKLQFEVSNTIPCDLSSPDTLEALCVTKKDGTATFRFALHVKDASSEMDVLCLGKAAEKLLGLAARDAVEKTTDKCEAALRTLKEMMLPGSVCEGSVRSIVGKGKQYFLLDSMFCIPPDEMLA